MDCPRILHAATYSTTNIRDSPSIGSSMQKSRHNTANFPTLHRALLTLFEKTRRMPAHLALREVHTSVEALSKKIRDCQNPSMLRAYLQYLDYFASRLADSSLAGLAKAPIESMLAKDPSRYDLLLLLAQHYLSHDRHSQSFPLLKRIAASRFSEAEHAQRLIARSVEECFK